MKKKIKAEYRSDAIYKTYCKRTNNPKKVSKTVYLNILKDFFSGVTDILILKGAEFTMPFRLGSIRIKKSKVPIRITPDGKLDKRRLRPDWNKCRALWKELYPDKSWKEVVAIKDKPMRYHENKHTDRWQHSWYWDKSTCLVKNNTAYSIDITRSNDRKLAKTLKREDLRLDYSLF